MIYVQMNESASEVTEEMPLGILLPILLVCCVVPRHFARYVRKADVPEEERKEDHMRNPIHAIAPVGIICVAPKTKSRKSRYAAATIVYYHLPLL